MVANARPFARTFGKVASEHTMWLVGLEWVVGAVPNPTYDKRTYNPPPDMWETDLHPPTRHTFGKGRKEGSLPEL